LLQNRFENGDVRTWLTTRFQIAAIKRYRSMEASCDAQQPFKGMFWTCFAVNFNLRDPAHSWCLKLQCGQLHNVFVSLQKCYEKFGVCTDHTSHPASPYRPAQSEASYHNGPLEETAARHAAVRLCMTLPSILTLALPMLSISLKEGFQGPNEFLSNWS
jgi:hypothetical protein